MDVVERVADIIRTACEAQECYLAGADDTARAAIAALFDWLEDLPPEVKNEAAKASQAQWGIGHTRYRDMITAARVAALNDVGPAYG